MKEKILTYNIVKELGLDKVSVITADMLDGYTSIGDYAFSECRGLTSVTIGNSVTSIGDYAFRNCSSLTSVTIPNSVTSIGQYAFSGCSGLTSIEIPNSVTSIGDLAFSGCSSLPVIDNIRYADIYLVEAVDKTLSTYTIKEGTRFIGDYAFEYCSGLTSVTIPNSVTSIGEGTFYGCESLTSVTIPNSVTSIGSNAFYGCSGLTSVTIGDKTYEKQTVTNDKCKAYKGFVADMTCRGFQYEEGKTYEFEGKPELCKCGFHACLNLADVFNYYVGEIGKDVVVHEVYLEGVTNERGDDTKVIAKKITIGKRIL